ncbi:PREDICTED: uncharacterized protein LOC108370128 [Rhagoletis zephyria]|uniref:uncharacterized protein LOC108370128 n=1 Tax=Rhagoletis zephyria TaxID=28612 RepID=UPI000811268D|nr:PREDICTED: uncharacterized protein LOC108370128 [Rhagoletis zephyria]
MSPPPAAAKRRLSKDSPISKAAKLDESAALPSILTALRELEQKVQRQSDTLQSLFEGLSNKIAEAERALCNKIDTEISVLSIKLTESAERISALESRQELLDSEVQSLRAQLERVNSYTPEESTAAVVFGLPFSEGENLKSIFNHICLSIDFLVPQIRDIFRSRPTNNSPNSAIIVKFYSSHDRNRTLHAFGEYRRRTKSLISLAAVGLEGNFSIFESLSSNKRKILQEAIRLRRAGKLASAFTLRGDVFIKTSKDSSGIKIDKLDDLKLVY